MLQSSGGIRYKKLARPEGFEPPTQGLELPGSIQAELRARASVLNFSTPIAWSIQSENNSAFFAKG